ncbi:hypothetical protein LY78DRAFT_337966 [Colletotrichum sublineola]|nr:hypothetical protein LY78DRAFT_337966 [Colletotrichum sublineola]
MQLWSPTYPRPKHQLKDASDRAIRCPEEEETLRLHIGFPDLEESRSKLFLRPIPGFCLWLLVLPPTLRCSARLSTPQAYYILPGPIDESHGHAENRAAGSAAKNRSLITSHTRR